MAGHWAEWKTALNRAKRYVRLFMDATFSSNKDLKIVCCVGSWWIDLCQVFFSGLYVLAKQPDLKKAVVACSTAMFVCKSLSDAVKHSVPVKTADFLCQAVLDIAIVRR